MTETEIISSLCAKIEARKTTSPEDWNAWSRQKILKNTTKKTFHLLWKKMNRIREKGSVQNMCLIQRCSSGLIARPCPFPSKEDQTRSGFLPQVDLVIFLDEPTRSDMTSLSTNKIVELGDGKPLKLTLLSKIGQFPDIALTFRLRRGKIVNSGILFHFIEKTIIFFCLNNNRIKGNLS